MNKESKYVKLMDEIILNSLYFNKVLNTIQYFIESDESNAILSNESRIAYANIIDELKEIFVIKDYNETKSLYHIDDIKNKYRDYCVFINWAIGVYNTINFQFPIKEDDIILIYDKNHAIQILGRLLSIIMEQGE